MRGIYVFQTLYLKQTDLGVCTNAWLSTVTCFVAIAIVKCRGGGYKYLGFQA
jgi:hypothetical protein